MVSSCRCCWRDLSEGQSEGESWGWKGNRQAELAQDSREGWKGLLRRFQCWRARAGAGGLDLERRRRLNSFTRSPDSTASNDPHAQCRSIWSTARSFANLPSSTVHRPTHRPRSHFAAGLRGPPQRWPQGPPQRLHARYLRPQRSYEQPQELQGLVKLHQGVRSCFGRAFRVGRS